MTAADRPTSDSDAASVERLRAAAQRVIDAWYTPDEGGGYGNEWEWRHAMSELRAALSPNPMPPMPPTPTVPIKEGTPDDE